MPLVSDDEHQMDSDYDGLPSYDESLSSLGNISKDSDTLYYDFEREIPLGIKDCDPDLWGKDFEYSPSVWDGSEGETASWTLQELDLVAYGVPEVFLRRIPEEASDWLRAKVYVELRVPDSYYFFIANVSALPTDVALRVPQCYFKIPNPNSQGWVPVVGNLGTLDGKPRPRRRRTRGSLGSRGKASVGKASKKRSRHVVSSSSKDESRARKDRKKVD